MKRLHNLDYLRGLAAFGIMIYHYMTSAFGQYDANTFLGKTGMYGVSIFYVLSGLTLYLVYYTNMQPSKTDVIAFARKRFFRIFPLLWLVTICTIIISRQFPDLSRLALNLTGLFGFLDWNKAMATGAWSIGNELVFYAFFPLFIFLAKRSKAGFALLSLAILCVYLHFAFNILDVNRSFTDQWRDYVNPLNQLFLFLGGFLIGMFFSQIKIPTIPSLVILFIGLAAYIFYPAPPGDRINLATGFTRIIFTIFCFVICLGFFKTTLRLPGFINKPLTLLGEASYSVYLLHPVVHTVSFYVFALSATHFYDFPLIVEIVTPIIITLVLSYFVYKKFEKYFMRLGHQKNIAIDKKNVAAPVTNKN